MLRSSSRANMREGAVRRTASMLLLQFFPVWRMFTVLGSGVRFKCGDDKNASISDAAGVGLSHLTLILIQVVCFVRPKLWFAERAPHASVFSL